MKRILFFTPYGGRSGSEMVLWYILEHFDRDLMQARLFCNRKGELLNSLPKDVESHYATRHLEFSLPRRILLKIENRILNKEALSLYEKQVISIHKSFLPDYWYLNTVLMGTLVPLARKLGVNVITHFHELPMVYEYVTAEDLENIIKYSKAIIGCSEAVCESLRAFRDYDLYLQHEFVDFSKIDVRPDRVAEIKRRLKIAPDDFVWVSSGTQDFRKGFDILPDVARSFDNKKTHFIWLGGFENNGLALYVKKRVESLGIRNIHFLGAQKEDYYNFLSVGDAFLLLSREDPFPLVMIEAAYLGKPIIAFNSGGVAEFMLDGMGEVVYSWNTADLVKRMGDFMDGAIKTDESVIRNRALEFCSSRQMKKWQNNLARIFAS